ncbi:MAG TPA: TIGR03087 family PEP-CTERM/XrtA system glycosyltransferase, partial [Candidatus Eisenbacteria bacterium]|nr:TIGR03087 family PEP-CTERM/XrtA system glycosyltransferase [Candidatus Eisenbacteria bacterium]
RADLAHREAVGAICRSTQIVYRDSRVALLRAGLALATGEPLSVAAFRSAELREKVRSVLARERIDAVIVFSSAMAQYVPRPAPVPVLLDMVDVDSEKWRAYGAMLGAPRAWVYRLEAKRLASFEDRVGNDCDHCVLATGAEAQLLRGRIRKPVSVVANGVDLDYFRPAAVEPGRDTGRKPAVTFVGMMDYTPNEDAVCYFAKDVLPLVQASLPETEFHIVGRNPAGRVRELERLPGVRVTGAVPDVRPYVAGAALTVAPFRIARGIQNKVLESMAMGRPVVGTPLAFQGLSATESDGVRMQDRPQEMAREILSLMRDPALAARCGAQARAYVEREHRWDAHVASIESILTELHDSSRSPERARRA